MPQPTASDVHEDVLLTNISVAYIQDEARYIANRVFPSVPVNKSSDKYRIYTKNDWFRDEAEIRAPGAQSAQTGFNLTTATYSADVWSLGHFIDEQVRANYDQPGDVERDTTQHLTQLLMIRRERQWVTDFFATGKWDTDVVGTTDFVKWDVGANSDPRVDVQTGQAKILQETGFKPNTLTVGFQVHQKLQIHPLIRDQFKYTSAESIDEAMLARYFGVERYLVSEAVFSSSAEAASTEVMAFIAGKNALLSYAPSAPSLMKPSAGYTFDWSGLTGMNAGGIRVLNIPAPLNRSVKIDVEMAFDMKVVASDLGYFFSNAVA